MSQSATVDRSSSHSSTSYPDILSRRRRRRVIGPQVTLWKSSHDAESLQSLADDKHEQLT